MDQFALGRFTDVYIRLCVSGKIHDFIFFKFSNREPNPPFVATTSEITSTTCWSLARRKRLCVIASPRWRRAICKSLWARHTRRPVKVEGGMAVLAVTWMIATVGKSISPTRCAAASTSITGAWLNWRERSAGKIAELEAWGAVFDRTKGSGTAVLWQYRYLRFVRWHRMGLEDPYAGRLLDHQHHGAHGIHDCGSAQGW